MHLQRPRFLVRPARWSLKTTAALAVRGLHQLPTLGVTTMSHRRAAPRYACAAAMTPANFKPAFAFVRLCVAQSAT
jgi:hypothetical protein